MSAPKVIISLGLVLVLSGVLVGALPAIAADKPVAAKVDAVTDMNG